MIITQGIDVCPDYLRGYISLNGFRFLHIGSGLATVLGGELYENKLNITCINLLANQYNELFKNMGFSLLLSLSLVLEKI